MKATTRPSPNQPVSWAHGSGKAATTLSTADRRSGSWGFSQRRALDAGAQVTGVEPQFFIDQAVQLDTITRLIVTDTMAERKAKMIELGDAFIAFPGGSGTLEEVSEVMSMLSLSHLDAPCIIYNLDGYYNHLKAQINLMIEKGFSTPERLKHVHFASNLNDVKGILGL